VQGPRALELISALGPPLRLPQDLPPFHLRETTLLGQQCSIARTGYTGEDGVEIVYPVAHAVALWKALLLAGREWGVQAVGLAARDTLRLEARLALYGNEIDATTNPLEAGLGWTVKLEREPFVGQAALLAESAHGAATAFVGLTTVWEEFEALHTRFGLPPHVPAGAWRTPVPLYDGRGKQVGYATSGAWSPILKQNLALASVRRGSDTPGTRLEIEVTVEFARHRVGAIVTSLPFYDPERKKA
jgi:aminomethyltransferase